MDSEEKDEIMSDDSFKKRRKKVRNKNKLKKFFNKVSLIKIAKILTITIVILLIFYLILFLLIEYQKDIDLKDIEQKLELNEKIKDEQNIQENINNNIDENILRNITAEIEKFEKTKRIIESKEILEFRILNSENILYDRIKYKRSDNPDISVILTMNNQAHCIHKAIRSIQNQSLKNIEIIIASDCSLDNSTETIKQYMKEDERIIFMDHDTNEGIMKIRVDAFKKAKGKYITVLDGSDSFIQKDILNNTLYVANLGNIDIVEFQAYMYIQQQNKGGIHFHKINGIIHQPELRTKFFVVNEEKEGWRPIVCRTIWGKLIKNDVLQKAINNIGTKYTEDYIMNYEDTIIVVSLFQIAQSYYLFKEVGYYYSRDERMRRFPFLPNKKCKRRENVIRNLDALKFLNFLLDKMADDEIERKTLCHEIISINYFNHSNFYKNVNEHYDMLYKVIDGIVGSKYLTTKEKEIIIKIKNEIKSKEKKNIF